MVTDQSPARLAVLFRRELAANGRAVRFRSDDVHEAAGRWEFRVRGAWVPLADDDLRAQLIRFLESAHVDADGRRLPFQRGPIIGHVLDSLRRLPP